MIKNKKLKTVILSAGLIIAPATLVSAVSCGVSKSHLDTEVEKLSDGGFLNKEKTIASSELDQSLFKFTNLPTDALIFIKSVTVNPQTKSSVDVKVVLRTTRGVESKEYTVVFSGFLTPNDTTNKVLTREELNKELDKITTADYSSKATMSAAAAVIDNDPSKLILTGFDSTKFQVFNPKLSVKQGEPTTLIVNFTIRQFGQKILSNEKTVEIKGFKAAS